MTSTHLRFLAAVLASAGALGSPASAAEKTPPLGEVVAEVIGPLMKGHGIPGMAVGVITPDGSEIFTFGVASKDTRKPVTADTLFEVGSVSKTFTATLASYAAVKGDLALTDAATTYVPELKGSALDRVTLLNLATHTSGGMPLQFPDTVANTERMMAYFKNWTPTYAPGTYRTYANPSIGLFGLIAAKAMKEDFVTLMEKDLYPALGLKNTYLDVPLSEDGNYAQGYTKNDKPVRMTPGVLDAEAYGVRTTAGDMVRFIEANMGRIDLDEDMRKAIAGTHTGYFRLGAMTQDLVWEQYGYPVALNDLLAGNSTEVSSKPNAVTEISPPLAPREDVWINKTGSTNGFGTYVAFVPSKGLGIVLLANKNYPMDARVTAAHQILSALDREPGK